MMGRIQDHFRFWNADCGMKKPRSGYGIKTKERGFFIVEWGLGSCIVHPEMYVEPKS
jgi:hypothetical protein